MKKLALLFILFSNFLFAQHPQFFWSYRNALPACPYVFNDYDVTNITDNSAHIIGSSIANGAYITIKGVYYGTTQDPLNDGIRLDSSVGGSGRFGLDLTGLTAGTTYYFMYYATNSACTGYSELYSFTTTYSGTIPSVNTAQITYASSTSANTGGIVNNDGGSSVTSRGVCWNTSGNPTISDSHTTDGSGTGSFSSLMTGLTAGTTYYVRAYATNGIGTGYGEELSYSGATLPSVSIFAYQNITDLSAYVSTIINSTGYAALTDKGIVWSLSENPTLSDYSYSAGSGGSAGSGYLSLMTNLTASTTYYIRPYAINVAGTYYGAQTYITTASGDIFVPTVTTASISNITSSSASGGGNVTSDGGATVTSRGVCWNTGGSPTIYDSKTTDGTGTGSFTSSITELSAATVYYVRSYATNSQGTSYGNEINFTTSCNLPYIFANSCGSATNNSIEVSANISSDGGCTVTSRGFQYSTDASFNTILGSVTASGTGTGQYSTTITGLSCGTHYYFRPWATNSVGTYYANSLIGSGCYTTSSNASIQTLTASNITSTSVTLSADPIQAACPYVTPYAAIMISTTSDFEHYCKIYNPDENSLSQFSVTFNSGVCNNIIQPNTLYYWKAEIYNGNATSIYGETKTVTTLP